ncbi:hypothetical protein GCM10020006_05890 [Fructilactobacillus sanfranciscensis]
MCLIPSSIASQTCLAVILSLNESGASVKVKVILISPLLIVRLSFSTFIVSRFTLMSIKELSKK